MLYSSVAACFVVLRERHNRAPKPKSICWYSSVLCRCTVTTSTLIAMEVRCGGGCTGRCDGGFFLHRGLCNDRCFFAWTQRHTHPRGVTSLPRSGADERVAAVSQRPQLKRETVVVMKTDSIASRRARIRALRWAPLKLIVSKSY